MVFQRIVVRVFLTCLGLLLIYYALYTFALSLNWLSFAERWNVGHIWYQPFFVRGQLALYKDLDPEGARYFFGKAIKRRPDIMDAWFALASAYLMAGNGEGAEKIGEFLFKRLSEVTTWKWNEFLLAYDLGNRERLLKLYNFVLAALPHRVTEADFVMLQAFGNWDAIVPYVDVSNARAFANTLMREKAEEGLESFWRRLQSEGRVDELGPDVMGRMVAFFAWEGRIGTAREIWQTLTGIQEPSVYNGGFENPWLNRPFDWQVKKSEDVHIQRSRISPHSGRYSLEVRFLGHVNLLFNHVAQLITVDPGRLYRLSYAYRTEGLTTDQKPYIAVRGYRCRGLQIMDDPVPASTEGSWQERVVEFRVPEECEALLVSVERKESFRFDSKIRGVLYLDDFRLEATGGMGVERERM